MTAWRPWEMLGRIICGWTRSQATWERRKTPWGGSRTRWRRRRPYRPSEVTAPQEGLE